MPSDTQCTCLVIILLAAFFMFYYHYRTPPLPPPPAGGGACNANSSVSARVAPWMGEDEAKPEEQTEEDEEEEADPLSMASISNISSVTPSEIAKRQDEVKPQQAESLLRKRIGQEVLVAGRCAEDTMMKRTTRPTENSMFFLPDFF